MTNEEKPTVYTKPNCPLCRQTKSFLDARKVDYKTIDVTEDADALKHIQDLGYQSLPVVEVSEDCHWSGHQLPKITKYILGIG